MSGDNISSPEGNDGRYDVPGPEHVEPEDLSPETSIDLGGTSDDTDADAGPADREDFSGFTPEGPAPAVDDAETKLFEELEPAGTGLAPEAEAGGIFDEAEATVAQAETAQADEPLIAGQPPAPGKPEVAETDGPAQPGGRPDRADTAVSGEDDVRGNDRQGDQPEERGSRYPVADAHQAYEDVIEDVQRAHAEVRDMIAQANAEIAEMIRTGEIHDIPPVPPRDWETDETEHNDEPTTWDEYEWEEYNADDEDTDDDRPVDWERQPEPQDDFEGIPYLTREAVEARTQASLEYARELTEQDDPINAGDYSQEIRSLDEMPKGGALWMTMTKMHILRADDVPRFSTEWQAHIEREQAARYGHEYAKDARPISGQGLRDLAKATLAKEFEGRHYFQETIPAVANGRCDPDQLRLILNESHPALRDKYGFFQPPARDGWPGVRDSALVHRPSRQVLQAREAVTGFVRSLPDGDRYARNPRSAADLGAIRLRAEVELYLRTRDPEAPQYIRDARVHRLASALNAPKIQYDARERPYASTLRQLPRELRKLYHNARMADPSARIFRLYR